MNDTNKIEYVHSSPEELAEAALIDAERRASSIIAEAEARARRRGQEILAETVEQAGNQILEEAKRRAELNARRIVREAEQRAAQIIKEAKKKAEQDASSIVSQAEQTASQIIEEAKRKGEAFECRQPEAARHVQIEAVPEGPRELPPPGPEEEESDFFGGTVEIALPPPISLEPMLQIHRNLKETPHVDVLNLGGSVDKGITIRISVETPSPLLRVLGELPGGEEHPLRRIIVTAKRWSASYQPW